MALEASSTGKSATVGALVGAKVVTSVLYAVAACVICAARWSRQLASQFQKDLPRQLLQRRPQHAKTQFHFAPALPIGSASSWHRNVKNPVGAVVIVLHRIAKIRSWRPPKAYSTKSKSWCASTLRTGQRKRKQSS